MDKMQNYDKWMGILSISVIAIVAIVFVTMISGTHLAKGTYAASNGCPTNYVPVNNDTKCCPSNYPVYVSSTLCCPSGYKVYQNSKCIKDGTGIQYSGGNSCYVMMYESDTKDSAALESECTSNYNGNFAHSGGSNWKCNFTCVTNGGSPVDKTSTTTSKCCCSEGGACQRTTDDECPSTHSIEKSASYCSCPSGYTYSETGYSNQGSGCYAHCSMGQYVPVPTTGCTACGVGYYKDSVSYVKSDRPGESCTKCPDGKTTNGTGKTSINDCIDQKTTVTTAGCYACNGGIVWYNAGDTYTTGQCNPSKLSDYEKDDSGKCVPKNSQAGACYIVNHEYTWASSKPTDGTLVSSITEQSKCSGCENNNYQYKNGKCVLKSSSSPSSPSTPDTPSTPSNPSTPDTPTTDTGKCYVKDHQYVWATSQPANSGLVSSITTADKCKGCETGYAADSNNNCVKPNSSPDSPSNPQTGATSVALVWMIGLMAIGYSVWYFKRSTNN